MITAATRPTAAAHSDTEAYSSPAGFSRLPFISNAHLELLVGCGSKAHTSEPTMLPRAV